MATSRLAFRDYWNDRVVRNFATSTKQRLFLSPAIDTVRNAPFTPLQRLGVLARDPNERGDLADTVPLVIGMPCIVTENIATSLGIANGSRGTLVGVCVHDVDRDLLHDTSVRI